MATDPSYGSGRRRARVDGRRCGGFTAEMTPDLSSMRSDYETTGLDVSDVHADPIVQFDQWLGAAWAAELAEPHAMVVSSVDADGSPDARVVLLRSVDADGFVFYTNYNSIKGRQLEAVPAAAATFAWLPLHRQVRVRGAVQKSVRRSPTTTSVRVRGEVSWAPGHRISPSHYPIGPRWSRHGRTRTTGTRTRCRARPTGAATGSCREPSSSGRAGPAGSTIGCGTGEQATCG